MGSVQRMATVVIVGLVALSTVLFLYLGDEQNRIDSEAAEQQEVAIERGMETYLSNCLQCHGPAGEGFMEPGAAGTGRVGAPLGGINTSLNQEGINAAGTPVAGGLEGRADHIHDTIYNGLINPDGTVRMPAFSDTLGGPLNDEQINELILFIQHADWNEVYNEAVHQAGGFPTPPPAAETEEEEESGGSTGATGGESGGASADAVTVSMHDMYFDPSELTIAADTPTTFHFVNDGAAAHDFTIDALDIHVSLNPGESADIEINAPAGEYEYYCSVPGHKDAGMVGTLTASTDVQPAESSGGEPAADSGEADAGAEGGEASASAAASVEVSMHDMYFDPTDLTIGADTPTTFHFVNDGAAVHDFTIDALDIHVSVNPGESAEIEVNAPEGTYEFYCSVPGHKDAGMVGTLTVSTDAAAAAPAAAEETDSGEADSADAESADDSGAAASADAVEVSMHDMYFDPTDLAIGADTPTTFHFVNEGAAVHDFTIDDLDIHVTVNPGESAEIEVNAPAGTYEFYCSVPGHKDAGMVGTLTVG
ncbi:MAG: cupredoxin domain-containing protein [Thermomicrobiales bacterium]|nr:cupredoxin domain-containing protein [Thermomicrobiales bacterium]